MLSPQPAAVFPRHESPLVSGWAGRGLSLAVCCCVWVGLMGHADARDMTGKAGFGFTARLDRGLSQVPALTFRYWQRHIAFETVAGFDWDVVAGELNDTRRFHGGAGLMWMWHDSQYMSASVGARAYTQITYRDSESDKVRIAVSKDGQTEVKDPLSRSTFDVGLLVSFPLQFEHFLSDHSSITASVAITIVASSAFTAAEQSGGAIDRPFRELSGATIQVAGEYGGGLGYTYYF